MVLSPVRFSLVFALSSGIFAAPKVLPPVENSARYAKIPMAFEPNRGQAAGAVKYLARGSGYTIFLTGKEAILSLESEGKKAALKLHLSGAGTAEPEGVDPQGGVSNYFLGKDPSKWRTHVPHFGRVRYKEVYPGIDVVYYGNQRRLEYDFLLAPGADAKSIRLALDGARIIRLTNEGDLWIETAAGPLKHHKPVAWQDLDGKRVEVAASYRLEGRQVGFRLGEYDRTKPLVIDPILSFSTFLGGGGTDVGLAIAVDATGSYITGTTTSTDFPVVAGGAQGILGGLSDVFVSKLAPNGASLIYSTFLGGSGDESGVGIAVDGTNQAIITGSTNSTNFPTLNPVMGAPGGGFDAFVAKLTAAGDALVYSTYLGGPAEDRGTGVAVDAQGNAYVAGFTASIGFPTSSALFASFGGGPYDGFVAKFSPAGGLSYSTYLGGVAEDKANAIAVNPATGEAFVTGSTNSPNFPTQAALRNSPVGGFDAFVAKLEATGTSLAYSTYLGGSADDRANGIAVDTAGAAYVAGWTYSTDFPTSTPAQPSRAGIYDAFVTKLTPIGTLGYSTYLGGNGEDFGKAIAVDSTGAAYVTGYTSSTDFPLAATSPALYGGRPQGVFVTKFGAAGNGIVYSTYLGGGPNDQGNGIAVDANKAAYVTGSTGIADFPTAGALSGNLKGLIDGFVTKLVEGVPVTTTVTTNPAALSLTVDGLTGPGPRFFAWVPGSSHTLNAPSPQGSGGTRQQFVNWSNGGAQSQTVTAPSADTTYTANFTTQYLLTLATSPVGAGTISATPSSADGYYTQGTSVQVTAAAAAGYVFNGFTGALTGSTSPQSVAMTHPQSVTATFACSYGLNPTGTSITSGSFSGTFTVTAGATCGYTASTGADWITLTSGQAGVGGGIVGFTVGANPNTTPRTGFITVAGGNTTLTYTINQAGVPPATLTVTSQPVGLQVTVDGQAYTTPASFQFIPGTQHTVAAVTPQVSAGVRNVFVSWSDGGAASHSVTMPATSLTVSATFTTSFQLSTVIAPPNGGTVAASPSSADGFYAPGTVVQLTATPTTNATFAGWGGALNGTANPQNVTMDAPKSVTANFVPQTCGLNYTLDPRNITVDASGGTFTVNVGSGAGCFWQAVLSPFFISPFLSITNGTGVANGSFQFTVQANATGVPRTASINVQGQLIQIVQHASLGIAPFFTDVPTTHPYFDYVTLMKVHSITQGCSDTQYCPDAATTRGQMAVFIIRSAIGDDFVYPTDPYFTDVPASHPYFKYIQKMRQLNITSGCSTTTYCPDSPVTRGQMAVFVVRAKLMKVNPQEFPYGATPYFTDVPTTHPYFAFIQKMKELSITAGCGATTYCADDPNTRGQMSVFIIRSFFTP